MPAQLACKCHVGKDVIQCLADHGILSAHHIARLTLTLWNDFFVVHIRKRLHFEGD